MSDAGRLSDSAVALIQAVFTSDKFNVSAALAGTVVEIQAWSAAEVERRSSAEKNGAGERPTAAELRG